MASVPVTAEVQVPNNDKNMPFDRSSALNDPQSRITKDFKIPKALAGRTAFWFDIYTKYGSNDHVIHHVLYPWIVYSVVDTSEINNNMKLHKWTRYHKANDLVKNETRKVRETLKKLAGRKSYKNLNSLEQSLFDSLASVPGSRSKVFKIAAANTRTQLGQRDFIMAGMDTSTKYLPIIEKMFKDAGLPKELTRLPFVESSFNSAAESKVGASGIWQIMPRTGKMYLTVNDNIDERNSPLKASTAAIKIFKDNYRILGQWDFAVSAYNHGPYGIKRAIKAARAKNMTELIGSHSSDSFQFASSNFYPSFLAILHTYEYRNEIFGSKIKSTPRPLNHRVLALNKGVRAKDLAKLTGFSTDRILEHNLDLKHAFKNGAWLPRGHKLLLPVGPTLPKDNKKIFSEAALFSPQKPRS